MTVRNFLEIAYMYEGVDIYEVGGALLGRYDNLQEVKISHSFCLFGIKNNQSQQWLALLKECNRGY